MITDDYSRRVVNYEEMHDITKDQLEKFVEAARISTGNIVLDAMAGYGTVTKTILRFAKKERLDITVKMLDRSIEQLHRPEASEIPGAVERIVCDMPRGLEQFGTMSVDRVLMKQGLYEVPKEEQARVITEIYRILKPKGIFVGWHINIDDKQDQTAFQEVIQRKDALAGYKELAARRYFFRVDELHHYLGEAGFCRIERLDHWEFSLDTKKVKAQEFSGKEEAWEEWCKFSDARLNIFYRIRRESGEKVVYHLGHQSIIRATKRLKVAP